jgi:hypothetical protein
LIRSTNTWLNITQRLLDVIVLTVVTWLVSGGLIPNALAKVLIVYCGLLLIMVFSLFRVYQPWQKAGSVDQVRRLAVAWCTVLVAFNLIILLLSTKDQLAVLRPYGLFASTGFNVWAMLVFGGFAVTRAAVNTGIGVLRRRGYYHQRAIVVGAGDTGRKLAHYFILNRWIGIELAGFFDDKIPAGEVIDAGSGTLGEVIGTIDDCYNFCVKEKIALVYVALPLRAEKKISRIVGRLGTSGHDVHLVQDLFSFGIQKARTRHLGELQVMNFNLFPIWKRVFDIVFSAVVVVITLPFWLLIMLAIKAEDGGPVFFGIHGLWKEVNVSIALSSDPCTWTQNSGFATSWIGMMRCGSNGGNATNLTMIPGSPKLASFFDASISTNSRSS